MYFKVLVVLSALFAFTLANLKDDPAHSINVCDTEKANKLLYQVPVVASGKFLQKITRTISYPPVGVNKEPITCILVADQDPSGKGGYPSIVNGGLTEKSVTITIVSQTGKGLNYMVSIYSA